MDYEMTTAVALVAGLGTAALIGVALSLRALWLRDHRPDRYAGFWHWLGESAHERRRALLMAIGLLLGGVVAAGIEQGIGLTSDQQLLIMLGLLAVLVALLGIVLGTAVRKTQQRPTEQERHNR